MTREERIIFWLDNEYGVGNDNVKIVKAALRKQVPKKVIEEQIVGSNLYLRTCPSCGVRFIKYGHGYCGECGQALKWSDNE